MSHYYNEWDKYAAQWLRNLIAERLIPDGEVDERSIEDVQPDDLSGFRQCHFFAGIGGWALAARLAGWPDDRELWTCSCPCQPFSVAGKQRGADDERHLWPHQFRLIRARRPAVWLGEQVAAAVGKHWLDGVLSDLEGIGYSGRAVVVPACAVDGPHRRDRIWIGARDGVVSDASSARLPQRESNAGILGATLEPSARQIAADDGECYCCPVPDSDITCSGEKRKQRGGEFSGASGDSFDSHWNGSRWIVGHDGKARRAPLAQSGIRLLAHGIPARVGKLRAYGNAIVPQVAAEVLRAWLDCEP